MLGIEENNNPIDIKYLTRALRDAIHKHPEREEYYKITFKDIYIMEEFQKRMCEEYKELADRLTKLQTALGKDGFREKVGDYQYKLMKEQAQGMEMYLKALTARMKDMDIDVNALISMNFGKAIEALKAGSAIRRSGWNGKGLFVVKQVPSHITGDIIPKMQSLPQSAKDILMSRENPHIDYTNQMLIINPDGRADSWVPSSSDVFAEDWEIVE